MIGKAVRSLTSMSETLVSINNPRGFRVQLASTPNKSRRWLTKPRVVLVHATAGATAEGALEWFAQKQSQVSADFVIDKTGSIWRVVPRGWYAWHAGVCSFEGQERRDYNRISYGIELINRNDGIDPYSQIQVEVLAFVVATIQTEAPTVTLLRRHADVAVPAGRKTDPAGLSIEAIYGAVRRFQPEVKLG